MCCATIVTIQGREIEKQTNPLKGIRNIDFYGIDFSKAKTYGAAESSEQFSTAFKAINMLLINEKSKYDLGRYLFQDDVALHLKHLNSTHDFVASQSDISTEENKYQLDQTAVEELIKGYEVESKYEIGSVLIAELLNKQGGYATYYFAFFDNKTKDIIAIYPMKCKARGFGLRNFWARSAFEAIVGIDKKINDK